MSAPRVAKFLSPFIIAVALAGCQGESASTSQAAAPVEVGIVTVKEEPQQIVRDLPGRVTPTRVAEVRARVSGPVVKRSFQQGTFVMPGDPLYEIDPRPFQVAVNIAEAALAKAQAVAFGAKQQADRVSTLLSRQAAAEAQNDTAVAARRQADAEVDGAKAALERAQLDLDYATVRAPISGQVGRALVTEGAMIQANTTHLATVQQLDPIYVDFTQSVSELSELRRNLDSGVLQGLPADQTKLRLRMEDGSVYEQPGKLLFSDASVDPSTGQVTLRGEFPNPRGELLAGMYVRGMVVEGIDTDAITVPVQAIQRTSAGDSEVFVVGADDAVARRPVRTGRMLGDRWLITDGLKAGDRVVAEGFQKITAGAHVKPSAWQAASASATTTDKH